MKTFFLTLVIIFTGILLFAQTPIKKTKPFIVQGCLSNFNANQLFLFYSDKNGLQSDTANVDSLGNFRLVTYKVKKPITAYLKKNGAFYTDLFIAPGYQLTIKANCKNYKSGSTNKQITGYGASANQYLFIRDFVFFQKKINLEFQKLNANDLLLFVNLKQRLCDSIEKIVFSEKNPPDVFYNFYRKKVKLDIIFKRLDELAYHTVSDTTLNYRQSIDYVNHNVDNAILSNLFKDEFLISDTYRIFMRDGYYAYLRGLNCKKKPSDCSNTTYYADCAQIITTVYKGKIKDLTLYNLLHSAIQYCRSFEELNNYKKVFPKYIAQISLPQQKEELTKLLVSMEDNLLKTQIGKPAPDFAAIDSTGEIYKIADFKNKVIVMDLWGSWCGPCRELTPHLKKLIKKFEGDTRLTFVSVAVADTPLNWKVAMKIDKPTGIQLLDYNGSVQNKYVANSVPKFVVINKAGNIVTFDAPISESFNELKKIIDQEISR